MKIIRSLLRSTNFYLASGLTLLYYSRHLKYEIKKFAETDVVYNERQYVLVRAARGDYTRRPEGADWLDTIDVYLTGFDQMAADYKFYKQVKPRVNEKPVVRPVKTE